MTRDEFTTTLEQVVRLLGPFETGRLLAYVDTCWPLIQRHPEAEYWADRFTEAQRQLART
jgi:hypothetical protein